MQVKLACSFILLVFTNKICYAQWEWPEGKVNKAKEMNVLYTDYLKQGNSKKALAPLHWLLVNAPTLNKSLYINAVKVYEKLALRTKDSDKRKIYADSTMECFELRSKYFNDEALVKDRQFHVAYKLFNKTEERYPYLIQLFDKTLSLNGNKISYANLVAFMHILKLYKKAGDHISDFKILNYYDQITEIIDQKVESGENKDKLDRAQETIDKILYASIKIDCSYIENTLGAKLKENPKDIKTANYILKLSIVYNCTELPICLEAAKLSYSDKPTYGIARFLGMKYLKVKEYKTAVQYFSEGLSLTHVKEKKSGLHLLLAVAYRDLEEKGLARKQAYMAASTDEKNSSKAYTLIGNLYLSSYTECKEGENLIEDRAIYFAAYEMFKKANNLEGMKVSKAQFPTAEEIFTYNMAEGDLIKIGCWVESTVRIMKR